MADIGSCISRITDILSMIFKMQIMSGNRKLSRQIDSFALELQHMKTFWMYAKNWKDADKDLQYDYSLLSDIEAAISKILDETSHARKELRSMACFNDSMLLALWSKIEVFRPRIKGAYDCLLKHYTFQSNSNSPMSCYHLSKFCVSLFYNLQGLMHEEAKLVMKEPLKALARNVKSIQNFVESVAGWCPENLAKKDLLTHLGCEIIRVAYLSYLCCVDQMDGMESRKMIFMIRDVQKKLIPSTPEFTKMYLKVLEASKAQASNSPTSEGFPKMVFDSDPDILVRPTYKGDLQTSKLSTFQETLENMLNCFLNILVPYLSHLPSSNASSAQLSKQKAPEQKESIRKDGVKALRQGLKCLIAFLIDAPNLRKEDLEPVMIDIKTLAIEVGCLRYPLMETTTEEVDIELFELLEKVELLKAEIMFLELLNVEANTVLVKDRMDSIHDGLTFLGTFLEQFGLAENHELFWLQIQALAMGASSLFHSFHAKEVTEETVKIGLFHMFEKIKLFKLEFFLLKLLNTNSSLMVPLKDQIETLYNDLIFLRTFLLGPLDENGKQILPRAQSVARRAASFYYSVHTSEITEELVSKMNFLLPDLLDDIMLVKVDISEIYQEVQSSFRSNLPKTKGLSFIDFFLGNVRDLMSSKAFSFRPFQNSTAESVFFVKHHIQFIYNEIKILRSFFKEMSGKFNELSELKNLGLRVMSVTYESEYLIDSFVVKDGVLWYHVIWLSDLIKEIELIKIQVSRIFAMYSASTSRIDELVVELPDQAEQVVNRLKGGSLQRDTVSIVGMPGIGKTTMAKKLYNEPSIIYHFHIRAWCCISQIYEKRKLLIDILSNINIEHVDIFLEMSEEDLEQALYRCLKGKRYLIVLDDVWSIEAWYDLERSLPNDQNGSRILITSRIHDVALSAQDGGSPHHLRLFTDDESWTLLQKKVFHTASCPKELLKLGKQIARGCKGLPLSVVTIAGLLQRSNKLEDWWKQVADNLNALIVDEPQTRCMDILELSYKHLPDHLKACFLYLGVFVEGKEISVRQLKCLWIAEGFIQSTTPESLEDVAEDYLMDLIDRSLVIVVKRRSRGKGVKVCNVHCIFRDFCLSRSREENFLQLNNRYDKHFASSELDYGVDVSSFPLNSITYEKHRLSICSKRKHFVTLRPSGPCVRSLLFFATSDMYPRCPYDVSFISSNFKLLRVLDLECINMGHSFPKGIELLVHLRYLSLSGDIDSVPSSIDNLWNLETFLLKGLKGKVILPDTIWRMERLRHIHVNCYTAFSLPDDILEGSFLLGNLVTFSTPSLSKGKDAEKIMRMLPKLRRLRCIFSPSEGFRNGFPVLDFLTELESLNIFYSGWISSRSEFNLPLNLKKLTLSNFHLPWNLISEIGRLPNLEVLKLLSRAFDGKIWDMTEGEFPKLKFLKLDTLNIAQWNASCDNLPRLEHLVLQSCKHLEEVPPDFVNIPTLQMIEMKFCSNAAEGSVRRLKEEIEGLKVIINQNVGI